MNVQDKLLELQREIYAAAQAIGRPIAQVMPWVFEPRSLQAAWQRVADADGARTPGPDGLTVRDLAGRNDRWLNQLGAQLYQGEFPASPPRYVDVPKNHGGGTRRLGILNVADRVVHAAVKQVLEPILEPGFAPGSFGFRPGRSVPGALLTAVRALAPKNGTGSDHDDRCLSRFSSSGSDRDERSLSRFSGLSRFSSLPFPYVCKLDVADCFDTIDHGLLLDRLRQVVSDEALLALVAQLLAAGGHTAGWLRRRPVGVTQGSGLSPLLCNFYLDSLDQALAALGRRSGGGIVALRYADDLLVLARTRRLARVALRSSGRALRRLGQRLKANKSAIAAAVDGIRWLGVDLGPRRSSLSGRIEFAYYVPDEKVAAMCERIAEITQPPSSRIDPAAFDLGRWLGSINEKLRDWWQAYVFADNAPAVFRQVDEFTFARVGDLLFALTGLRRRALWDEYQQRLPRGFRTWRIGGVQLTVLSSLAPRNPAYLTRRPAWMVNHARPAASPPAHPRPLSSEQ